LNLYSVAAKRDSQRDKTLPRAYRKRDEKPSIANTIGSPRPTGLLERPAQPAVK